MRTMFTGSAVAALMLMATPALAEDKADRARQAIAEAQGKVQTLNNLGAAGDTPRMVAQAQAALRSARDNLKGGHKDEAIADALRASELADTAVNLSRQAQAQNSAAAQVDATLQAQAAAAQAAAAAASTPAPATTVTTETTTSAPRTTAARRTTTRGGEAPDPHAYGGPPRGGDAADDDDRHEQLIGRGGTRTWAAYHLSTGYRSTSTKRSTCRRVYRSSAWCSKIRSPVG